MRTQRDFRRPWSAGFLALAVVATTGLGCGKNRVLLDVDVRSFMADSEVVHAYAMPPLIPLSSRIGGIPVNLVEGFKDFGNAESATMDVGLEYDNQTGQGQGRFVIYFGDDPATLFSSPPVATLDTDLQPGVVSTGAVQIQTDQRVLDLFTSKNFLMGVDLQWTPVSAEALSGSLNIAQIHVHMVSTMGLFN